MELGRRTMSFAMEEIGFDPRRTERGGRKEGEAGPHIICLEQELSVRQTGDAHGPPIRDVIPKWGERIDGKSSKLSNCLVVNSVVDRQRQSSWQSSEPISAIDCERANGGPCIILLGWISPMEEEEFVVVKRAEWGKGTSSSPVG